MLKKVALWHMVITSMLITMSLIGSPATFYLIVAGLVGVGWMILRKFESANRVMVATISLSAVALAGIVIPNGMRELSRNLELLNTTVLAISAFSAMVILGVSIELIRRIATTDRNQAGSSSF